eukprot:5850575-Alexandrium_andersonii.AAC.1
MRSIRAAATAQGPPCPGTWFSGVRWPCRGKRPDCWSRTAQHPPRRWAILGRPERGSGLS